MTYNGYFTTAVSFGSGIGYLVFGPVLIEIGIKNGGLRRPRRVCRVCVGKFDPYTVLYLILWYLKLSDKQFCVEYGLS
jgi:hypothetical protein